ncbi:mannose-6-phosphate isomerase [Fomitopsis serialis]|uniref:mannose-6-phosphate isomerase n=1 Tax=Fomitopsis serialis TaxID=139415 RepID=UPI0020073B24|nr:mannose-6-phosphate isomerase [Neoantrodia serialis]XP_047893262.1 mannose-6-phosphate isomerase [Neoantrodia serialis]KAH9911116.1 mannose-6-phosphate isomerase [Neoantrodia serialis]KAH9925774.1 mannose-6-phosphate isomerase [Neoantrodia serialis]
MSHLPVFKIVPTTQKYDWGKIGLSSKVAQYAAAAKIPGFSLDEKAPYAELWMGTHPNGPSRLAGADITLAEHLAAHPELMGPKVVSRFRDAGAEEGNLPFLFKVLAIEKALSIQTHPDKKTAEALHKEKPNVYKDANHKPEMALALTPFTAMCGFLPLSQIATYLTSTPEFAALIPETITTKFLAAASSADPTSPEAKTVLKDLFSALMTADEAAFKASLADLVKRYEASGANADEAGVKDLVLRLNSQFPGDIGVFCAFILNYVKMQPGEAIFLAAGEPHAYVSGDIMECMATSDNVIRAGLTPKLRDIPNLVSGLTYGAGDASRHMVKPAAFDSAAHTALYNPPIPEFSVLQVLIPSGETEVHPPIEGPSIAIVTEGKGALEWAGEKLVVAEGDVLFIGAGTGVKLLASGDGQLAIYRAFVEAS